MRTITITNLDDSAIQRLEHLAAESKCTFDEYVRFLLTEGVTNTLSILKGMNDFGKKIDDAVAQGEENRKNNAERRKRLDEAKRVYLEEMQRRHKS